MKTLKVLLQEVVSGIKAWVNSNFAQESNTVHKTGNETVNGVKTFTTDVRSNTRFEHRDTVISSKEAPSSERKTDTFSHIGSDGTYWGGLKHCWYASGISATQICVANHKLSGSTWTQGFWAINLGTSKDFSSVYFAPTTNNGINLGTLNYQWNNVYAKNYYYNGTEFQNKFVTTDTDQVIPNFKRFKKVRFSSDNTIDITQTSYSDTINVGGYGFNDNAIKFWGDVELNILPDATSEMKFNISNWKANGVQGVTALAFRYSKSLESASFTCSDKVSDLGTTDRKWKSFNGINPGALSFPNVNAVTGSSNTQLQDISGDLVQDQYFNCYFTPRMDGWAYIALDCSSATIKSGCSSYTVSVKTARGFANSIYTQSFTKNENAFSNVQIFIPVTANKEITLECTFTGFSVTKGYVIPCLGNV